MALSVKRLPVRQKRLKQWQRAVRRALAFAPKKSRRACYRRRKGPNKKQGNKRGIPAEELNLQRLEAKRDALDALISAKKATLAESPQSNDNGDEPVQHDDYENRIVVKFYWKQAGCPTDPEDWKWRDGTISFIRRRMGKGAPARNTVERILKRLAEDENDDLASRVGSHGGRPQQHDWV